MGEEKTDPEIGLPDPSMQLGADDPTDPDAGEPDIARLGTSISRPPPFGEEDVTADVRSPAPRRASPPPLPPRPSAPASSAQKRSSAPPARLGRSVAPPPPVAGGLRPGGLAGSYRPPLPSRPSPGRPSVPTRPGPRSPAGSGRTVPPTPTTSGTPRPHLGRPATSARPPQGTSARPTTPARASTPPASPDRIVRDLNAVQMAVMRLSTEMGAVKARLELLGQQLEEGVSGEDGSDRLGTVERGLADLERAAEAVEARMMQRLSDVEKHLGALTTRLSVLTDRLGENDESLAALRQHLDGASAPPLRDEGADDDLTAIKGIGPKYETALKRAGVRTYRQIAEWSDDQVVEIAAKIGTRPERIRKADWMGSARALLDG